MPDVDVDIIFYHAYWYRPYKERWYQAKLFDGPRIFIASSRVPRVLIELPLGYRRIYPGQRRIPYAELNRNWRRWERDKYRDRDKLGGKEGAKNGERKDAKSTHREKDMEER
ncbi:MAG TPA: hypothetical protein DCP92_10715 [Nitrospiraceae bacterium]|jgi:hypothetical protein|nr:hypothetical protein [Nitrospiraceae bacterium]